MTYKINTTLDAIAEAWNILDELGLSALLIPGNDLIIKPVELATKLLKEKRLHDLISAISDVADPGAITLAEAAEVITAFFVDMAGEVKSLAGLISVATPKPKPSDGSQ